MLETTFNIGDNIIEIWRWGVDDYSINFYTDLYSVRGSLKDILEEFIEWKKHYNLL